MNEKTQQAFENGKRLITRLKTIAGVATSADVHTIVDSARDVFGPEIQSDKLTESLTALLG